MSVVERVLSPRAPAPIGPYSQASRAGGLVFVSGQLGVDSATGRLVEGLEAQAEQAMRNLGAVLEASGSSWAGVVKTTIYLTDMSGFSVVNGVYSRYFPPEAGFPARATVGVASLPAGALVEVEAVAAVP
ncbi:MAG: Rid family detoxifying hydrolase [Acetobacteraceae bacterium]|nr:Rid family detoxifying hydrolase [Acetobacteraceae bacterium]